MAETLLITLFLPGFFNLVPIMSHHRSIFSWYTPFYKFWISKSVHLRYRVSQKEVPLTFDKSLKQIRIYLYSFTIFIWLESRKRIMFLEYCEKMRLFENPNFKIWAIEQYHPRNLLLQEIRGLTNRKTYFLPFWDFGPKVIFGTQGFPRP